LAARLHQKKTNLRPMGFHEGASLSGARFFLHLL
jgi:hypothetical protein